MRRGPKTARPGLHEPKGYAPRRGPISREPLWRQSEEPAQGGGPGWGASTKQGHTRRTLHHIAHRWWGRVLMWIVVRPLSLSPRQRAPAGASLPLEGFCAPDCVLAHYALYLVLQSTPCSVCNRRCVHGCLCVGLPQGVGPLTGAIVCPCLPAAGVTNDLASRC